MLPSVYFV